jgi:hypothetical protein
MITGAGDLRILATDLKQLPAKLQPKLRTRLSAAGEPMKTAVQRHALAIPATGPSTGLRQQIAAATKIRTTVTSDTVKVRVWVDSSAMPPGQEALPALMENAGWKHPVFGRGSVFQRGHAYFNPAVTPLLPSMHTAVERAVDEAIRTIR